MDYFLARISGCAKGGQIMVSDDTTRKIKASVLSTEEAAKYSALQNAAVEAIRDLSVIIQGHRISGDPLWNLSIWLGRST